MNLKESYRYANYLDGLLSTAYSYLRNKGFVTTTKQNHLRSKANNEAQDEIIEVQKPYDVEFTPNNVVDFVIKVLNEKETLFNAIADAKAGTEINIDNAIAYLNENYPCSFQGLLGTYSISYSLDLYICHDLYHIYEPSHKQSLF